MGLTLVTAAGSDPISLAEARAQCELVAADRDGLLAGYILAARQHAETYLRRAFVTPTWDLTLDNDWPCKFLRPHGTKIDRIVLPKPPAQTITSIAYVDTSGITQTLAVNQYRLLSANQERGEACIEPAFDIRWPAVRRQAEAITVRFVCGYHPTLNPFPEPIRQAMLLLIGHWFENREAVNVGNILSEFPLGVEALLFPYRVIY